VTVRPVTVRADRGDAPNGRTRLAATIASVCALLVAALAPAAPALAAKSTGPQRVVARCAKGQLAGTVCIARHARCEPRDAAVYAARGLICVRARLTEGGLAVQREGGAFAVGANGHVGLAEAEQAFIATFARLPGVKRIPGAVKLPRLPDVTGPLLWISQDLRRLPRADRTVVGAVLARADEAHAAAVANPLLSSLEPTLIKKISNLTGVTLSFTPTVLAGTNAELGTNPYVGGSNGGFATPVINSAGQVTGCRILINQIETTTTEIATNVEGHELTHCFQFAAAGTTSKFVALPTYFVEGFADWAGDELELELDGADPDDPSAFAWINNPFRDLFARDYDAFPLFDEVAEEMGGPGYVWARFQQLVAASSATGIYNVLAGAAAPYFARNLATNPLLDPGLGTQWTFDGVGLAGQTTPELRDQTVGNGDTVTFGAPPRASDRARIDLKADIVTIAGTAPGGLHLSDGRTLDVTPTRLCDLQGGCACPDGSNPVDEGGQSGQAVLAIWGGVGGAKVTLSGESKNAACGIDSGSPGTPSGPSSGGITVKQGIPGSGSSSLVAHYPPAASCTVGVGDTLTVKVPATGSGLILTIPNFHDLPIGAQGQRELTFDSPRDGGADAVLAGTGYSVGDWLPDDAATPTPAGGGYVANDGKTGIFSGTMFHIGADAPSRVVSGNFDCGSAVNS